MKLKTCFKCHQIKPISDFYPHKKMADGHLNKCIVCAKNDEEMRRRSKMLDPEWREKELSRQRKKSAKARLLGTASKTSSSSKKNYIRRNPHKKKAHEIVQRAIKSGLMRRLPCEVCGKLESQAHHDDYSLPLNVNWLCSKHHGERHVELNRIARRSSLDTAH